MPRRPPASLLLASVAPLDVPVTASPSRTGVSSARGRAAGSSPGTWSPGRWYALIAAIALGLAALSLLAPSTPSYDPWSWLIWGREIVHGHLVITSTGTSWKPLPMLFTIPFALLGGSVAPELWLVVARAGAIAAVLMAFRLAHRLTRELTGGPDEPGAAGGASDPLTRAAALLAGLIALLGLGFAARGDFITSNGLGYSEALAATLLLVAVECHLDGRFRATFLIGFLVALDRPEIWLFWVPYGLWLTRRDAAIRPLVALAFVLQPVAWFLPVYLGSGHLGSSVTRATHPRSNSLAFASDPFWAELSRAAWPTMMMRLKIMAGLVMLGTPLALWRARRRTGPAGSPSSGSAARRHPPAPTRSLIVAALLGLGGLAWFLVIAVMTQIGFSGNDRYLVLGAALVDVCAAVGFGWLALRIGRAWSSLAARRAAGAPTSPRAAALVGAGLAAAAFALLPTWIETQDFVALPKIHRALLYQARLRSALPRALELAGGRRAILSCGAVMTEGFQVPMVAYALDVPTTRVIASPLPGQAVGPAPDIILQTRDTQGASLLPRVRSWDPALYTYRGTAAPWHTFTHCDSAS